jgi:hypothetical protein
MDQVKKPIGRLVRAALACALAATLTSCATPSQPGQGQPSGRSGERTWVIYWYLCGSNLESEYGCASTDIEEMMKVSLPSNVEIIIQTGGSKTWESNIDPNSRSVWRYCSSSLQLLESWPKANMGDPGTLTEFLDYCNANYPAEHRMLLFWDHGGGSLGGVCNDEQYGMDSLKLPELAQALAAGTDPTHGSPLYDIVGFDACLMANIDTAAVFAGYARYMVASQDVEPGSGWDYTGFLKALQDDSSIDAEELGRAICDTYLASMSDYSRPLATLSLIDLDLLGPLLDEYGMLGDEALVKASQDTGYMGAYGRSARSAENFFNNASSGYSCMMDLGSMVLTGRKEELFPIYGDKVLNALYSCVAYNVVGSGHQRAQGLSCFYNYEGSQSKLQNFMNVSSNLGLNYFYDYTLTGKLSADAITYAKQASATIAGQTIEPEPLDTSALETLEGYELTLGADGQWQLDIGAEASGLLAAVYVTQAWVSPSDDEGTLLGLYGLNGYFPHDHDNGVFTANFQNDWGALGELPVYMEPLKSDEQYDFYTAPVLINGTPYYLVIMQGKDTGDFELLGAMPPIDMRLNIGGKELYQLQDGDVVEAVMFFLLPEGQIDELTGTRLVDMPLGEITYHSDTVFHLRPVSFLSEYETDWAYFMIAFVMIDYAGNIYYSAPGYYRVLYDEVEPITSL